jgi:GDPmannose 4,6-dehydratase
MTEKNTKTALISGISGQDGAYLAKLLLEKGYTVYGSSRDAYKSNFSNLRALGIEEKVTVVSMALNDFRSVIQVLKKIQADEIYNLAGQTSVGLSFDQPMDTLESIALGTFNLLEAIRFLEKPIKLYNAGSSECFGDTGNHPACENTPFQPRSPYAVAKSTAFWAVHNYREAYQIYACSGILFNHESCLRPPYFVTQKIISGAKAIATGKQDFLSLGNLNIARDWGWAPEYVEAMYLMMQQEQPDDYVIATGCTHTLAEFVETAFSYVDLDWTKYIKYSPEFMRPTDIAISRANPEKAHRCLGWKAKYTMPEVVEMMLKRVF